MKTRLCTYFTFLSAVTTLTALISSGALAAAPAATAPTAAATTAAVTNTIPTDKASYFANADLENIWKALEAKQVSNQRILEGGSHSVNVRIVTPSNAPLVHHQSVDVWVVTSGSATAITGGELLNQTQRANADDIAGTEIRGGVEQPLKPGDLIFVPPGVPHGFKDVKNFRAFLIRFDTKAATTP